MNMDDRTLQIPLFPLNTVLLPGGFLPLRIFEPRYLDMVSRCLRDNTGIGVILIREGMEVGEVATTFEIGTLCDISYWHKRNDGLLGVTLAGRQRFHVISSYIQDDNLMVAEVELLPNLIETPISEEQQGMADLLSRIIAQLEPPFTTMKTRYQDIEWVTGRLVELLPLSLADKQDILQTDDVNTRFEQLEYLLSMMQIN